MEPSSNSRTGPDSGRGSLGGLDYLVRLQAARADVDAAGAGALVDPDLLEVRVEAAPGRDHRVAARVSERGLLAAAVAYLGHRRRHGSDRAAAVATAGQANGQVR